MSLKRKFTKATLVAIGLTMMMAVPAYAKDGPEDWYDSYIEKTRIRVGDDMEAGRYILINSKDTRDASVTLKRDGDTIWSESFWTNYIIDVEDGDTLSLVGAYAIEYDDAESFTVVASEEGFFEVGVHIQPGKYDVEYVRGNDGEGFVRIWSDLQYADNEDYLDYQEEASVSRGSKISIKEPLMDGYFVELNGCRLIPYSGEDK